MPSLNQMLARVADVFGAAGQAIPLANRNLIVDGAKDIWSSSGNLNLNTTGTYTNCVMCAASSGTGGVATYGQGVWTASPGNPTMWGMQQPLTCYGQFNQTTASTGSLAAFTGPFVGYPIENVMACEGQSFTLSVWLWCNSGTLNITQVYASQSFGSGGSPSGNTTTAVNVNWILTTTPRRFSVRIDVPSIIGKTIGTITNGYTAFRLGLPVGSTFIVNDSQWQLEKSSPRSSSDLNGAGGAPTAFEYRGIGPELARVQRYYETGNLFYLGYQGGSGSQSISANSCPYKVTKRANPAVSFTRTGQAGVTSTTPTGLAFGSSPVDQFTPNVLTTGVGGYNGTDTWIADSRL